MPALLFVTMLVQNLLVRANPLLVMSSRYVIVIVFFPCWCIYYSISMFQIVGMQAYFALVLAMIGVSRTNAMASDSAKANDSAVSIFSILDRKSQIDSSSEEGSTLANVKGDIDFKHVSFKYPSRPHVQIFTDFTLGIPSGKV